MALSNIFREPRREITESVVGVAAFGGFALADYLVALGFLHLIDGTTDVSTKEFVSALFLSTLAILSFIVLLFITHAIGDGICNALQRNDIHLRPRDRRPKFNDVRGRPEPSP